MRCSSTGAWTSARRSRLLLSAAGSTTTSSTSSTSPTKRTSRPSKSRRALRSPRSAPAGTVPSSSAAPASTRAPRPTASTSPAPTRRCAHASKARSTPTGGRPHARLADLDPVAAEKITVNDVRRIVRALEVIELTGRPFTASLPEYTEIEPTIHIGLALDRHALHDRIARRVDLMWEAGWVDEVRTLLDRGLASGKTASRAIGYAQIQDYLAGTIDADAARESTTVRTRQFARRQDTWFRRDPRITWIDSGVTDAGARLKAAQSIVRLES